MRRATAAAALAVAVLAVVSAGAATSARPVLLSTGAVNGHITARWSLPPGADNHVIEVSATRKVRSDGSFAGFPDFGILRPRQTIWRSPGTYRPAVYYVHVSATDANGELRWSNVRAARVPGARLRDGTYRGTTSQGQQIELVAGGGVTRITRLRYAITLRCGGSSRRVSYDLRAALAVGLEGSFQGSFVFPAGTTVKGTFHGASASGTLRQNYFDGNLHARCDSGLVRWSARRS